MLQLCSTDHKVSVSMLPLNTRGVFYSLLLFFLDLSWSRSYDFMSDSQIILYPSSLTKYKLLSVLIVNQWQMHKWQISSNSRTSHKCTSTISFMQCCDAWYSTIKTPIKTTHCSQFSHPVTQELLYKCCMRSCWIYYNMFLRFWKISMGFPYSS